MSIRTKLILSVVLVHLVLISLFVADTLNRQKEFLMNETHAQARNFATLMAESLLSWVLAEDLMGMDEVLRASARLGHISYACVVTPEGRTLAHTDSSHVGAFLTDTEAQELLKGTNMTTHVWRDDPFVFHVAAPLEINDKLMGWTLVGVDMSNLAAHLQELYTKGLIYIFIAMICGGIAAWLLSTTIFRQLVHIMGGISRLRNNDFSSPIKVFSNDEFGQMARALNRTSEALRLSRNALKKEIHGRMEAEEQIRYLTRCLVDGNEEERKRLGHDLHDEFGQSVTGLLFGLHTLKKMLPEGQKDGSELCEQMISEFRRFGEDIRRMAAGQYPVVLERLGLAAEASSMLAEISKRNSELKVNVDIDLPSNRLNPRIEVSCFRILQAGLANVLRHSNATVMSVQISIMKNWLYLRMADNGKGFDAEAVLEQHGGYSGIGIMGMRARVLAVNGNIEFDSRPGSGCTIDVFLPLEPESV